ncbi:BhlA/UviB family holin-like peptide [Cytobacillus oceanisediminis]|uniref:BhlA/UviB family holin-like peptide n=1 Tax=Cytobacillus oceanisediminis TaxID=665099 RepID=UPI003736CDD8
MEEQVFNMFIKEGGFALLFVWMLFSTMKNNKERETKYQEVIDKNQSVIEEQAKAFSSLSKDVTEIKQILVDDKGVK